MSSFHLPSGPLKPPQDRLAQIQAARRTVILEGRSLSLPVSQAWIESSWQRCLAQGFKPNERVNFDLLPPAMLRRTQEANQQLVRSARPILEGLGRAIVNTRYFAILTNAQGVVVDVSGQIDRSDPRADLITRIGTDLSESRVGTTAIGAALTELRPVWLHRGEHFFDDTSVYSCAGAPLFGPGGECVGMLDVTGIDTSERPELKHLVTQSALRIQNALVLAQPHSLVLRLTWPGAAMGGEMDGLICVDDEGWITGANGLARDMVSELRLTDRARLHASEVFALPYQLLFDARRHPGETVDLPLWSGLHLQAQCHAAHSAPLAVPAGARAGSLGRQEPHSAGALKDVEAALIRQAVQQARGNVAEAARALGISRATVYRKIAGNPTSGKPTSTQADSATQRPALGKNSC